MPSLAESQSILRHAIAGHDATEVPSMLTAPGGAASRFFIYRRHYRASLASHIRGRFPTVEWLLGSVRMLALAEQFACETPPSAPCMAEYGGDFVACLARSEALRELPYMDKVALLDWHLGDVAVAIDYPALAITGLRYREPDQLLDLLLALQPGVRYLDAGWPVDDLLRVRLGDRAPEQLDFEPSPVALQIRGARGRFGVSRIDTGTLRFRVALSLGRSLGDAAGLALDADRSFDVSHGLAAIFAEGLVIRADNPNRGEHDV